MKKVLSILTFLKLSIRKNFTEGNEVNKGNDKFFVFFVNFCSNLKLARSRWAAIIKRVYEVDPLHCPKCGQEMRIIAFIEKHNQYDVIEGILKRCNRLRRLQ